jgi:glycosyltransferase involved in cell wall biosynthesis
MRIGRNPLTGKTLGALPDKVMTVTTHLPNFEGYHENRLDVVKLCLNSMRNGTSEEIPVIIFDNGSCEEFTDWLREEYRPYTLVLSPNIGKSSARAALVRMVRSDAIITVTDDDMLFYPGWFDASMELLTTFPNVGKVSCYPVRTMSRWGCDSTKAWAKANGKVEVGKFISEEEDFDFCTSIGREYDWQKEYTKIDVEHRVNYNGVQAYCMGHHCQFMAYANRIIPFCVRSESCMHDEKPFDIAIDQAGYLQLTTTTRYARHIGNYVDKKVEKEALGLGLWEAA